MRQRGGSEQPVKGRRANRPKAHKVSSAAPSVADLQKQVSILTRDLKESLEYQTATSDVLQVISRSTFDLQPVLDTVLATAARLCSADIGGLMRRDGEAYRMAAGYALPPDYNAFLRNRPLLPGRDTVTGRTALEGRIVHIADIAADLDYAMPESTGIGKIRTSLGVPLLRESEPIGVFWLARQRIEPLASGRSNWSAPSPIRL
jgi:hypothetical protein